MIAAAVLHNDKVLSNVVANQLIHAQYGGVVPELASRAHQQNMSACCSASNTNIKEQLSAIAFTQGPGLMGSLLVGSSAKSMALALEIHCCSESYAYPYFSILSAKRDMKTEFPTALTISGGHTQIVEVKDYFD
jgi:N6-L-threonylcarbamoyladenine synthase